MKKTLTAWQITSNPQGTTIIFLGKDKDGKPDPKGPRVSIQFPDGKEGANYQQGKEYDISVIAKK